MTCENVIKMMHIYMRSVCDLPLLIMGETGVGKTLLIEFFVKELLNNKLMVFNVHAGVGKKQIEEFVKQIKNEEEALKKKVENKVN